MSLAEGVAHFGLASLNYLPANESLVYSPLSMFLALGVIYTGMNGTTKREFTQRFNQGPPPILLNFHSNSEYYNMDNFMLKANTSDLVWSELVKSIERKDITFLTVMLRFVMIMSD